MQRMFSSIGMPAIPMRIQVYGRNVWLSGTIRARKIIDIFPQWKHWPHYTLMYTSCMLLNTLELEWLDCCVATLWGSPSNSVRKHPGMLAIQNSYISVYPQECERLLRSRGHYSKVTGELPVCSAKLPLSSQPSLLPSHCSNLFWYD